MTHSISSETRRQVWFLISVKGLSEAAEWVEEETQKSLWRRRQTAGPGGGSQARSAKGSFLKVKSSPCRWCALLVKGVRTQKQRRWSSACRNRHGSVEARGAVGHVGHESWRAALQGGHPGLYHTEESLPPHNCLRKIQVFSTMSTKSWAITALIQSQEKEWKKYI